MWRLQTDCALPLDRLLGNSTTQHNFPALNKYFQSLNLVHITDLLQSIDGFNCGVSWDG